jgi:hypothetical protein
MHQHSVSPRDNQSATSLVSLQIDGLIPFLISSSLSTIGVKCESLCDNLSTCSSSSKVSTPFCLAREGSTYTLVIYSQTSFLNPLVNSTSQCQPAPAESLICTDASCALDLTNSQYGLAPTLLVPETNNDGSSAQNTQQIFLYLILPLIALAVTLPCIFLKFRSCFRSVYYFEFLII